MKNKQTITKKQVKHIADLANIPLEKDEAKEIQEGFEETLHTISDLKTIDIEGVEPTHQVTGLKNVFREDEVDNHNMLSQEEALANAPQTHEGYFVVPRIIEEK